MSTSTPCPTCRGGGRLFPTDPKFAKHPGWICEACGTGQALAEAQTLYTDVNDVQEKPVSYTPEAPAINKENDMENPEDREYRVTQKVAAETGHLEAVAELIERTYLAPVARIDFVLQTKSRTLELHTDITPENCDDVAEMVNAAILMYRNALPAERAPFHD